jgi:GNAT superfamily N-acetyltransferase
MEMATRLQSPARALTEAAHARYLERKGERIQQHQGRFWKAYPTGFYHPTHNMARLSREEALARPTHLCWGFRMPLRDEDADLATGTMPIHLLTDLAHYDLQRIKQSRRTIVRKFWKNVEVVQLTPPKLLKEQAYQIVLSDHNRHGYGRLPSREEYLSLVDQFFEWELVTLAGLVDGKLGGFATVLVVGSSAYIEEIQVASEAMNTGMATGLLYEIVQVCKHSPGVQEVVHALHARENQTLSYFKEDLGFRITHIPQRVWLAPLAKEMIRRMRPHAYYRLFGHD